MYTKAAQAAFQLLIRFIVFGAELKSNIKYALYF